MSASAAIVSMRGSISRYCPSGYYNSVSELTLNINGVNTSRLIQTCDNNPAFLASIKNEQLAIGLGVGIPFALLVVCIVAISCYRRNVCCHNNRSSYLYQKGAAVAVPLKPDNQVLFEALGTNLHRQFQMSHLSNELHDKLSTLSHQELESALWVAQSLRSEEMIRVIRIIMENRGNALPLLTKQVPVASAPV